MSSRQQDTATRRTGPARALLAAAVVVAGATAGNAQLPTGSLTHVRSCPAVRSRHGLADGPHGMTHR